MSFVSDSNFNPEEDDKKEPAGQVSGAPNLISGQGQGKEAQGPNAATQGADAPTLASESAIVAPTGSATTGTAPTADASKPTSSGQWTNLQKYLDVNNGGDFGKQFSGKIQEDVSGAQNSLSSAADSYAQAVKQGTLKNNPDVLNQLQVPVSQAEAPSQPITFPGPPQQGVIGINAPKQKAPTGPTLSTGTNPVSPIPTGLSIPGGPAAMTDADKAAFKAQLGGSYTGPEGAVNDQGFQKAYGQAQNAFSEAKAAQTPGGQEALLSKFYKAPNYTQGAKGLDAAILSGDTTAQDALRSLYQNASALPVGYQSAANQADVLTGNARGQSAQAQQAAANALYGTGGATAPKGGALGSLIDMLNNNATTAKTNYEKQQSDIAAAAKAGNFSTLTPDEQKIVSGFNINAPKYTYGTTPYGYIDTANRPSDGITAGNLATKDQAAQLAALAQLAGQAPESYIAGTPGTAPTGPAGFRAPQYQDAIKTAKAGYMNARNNLTTQIQDIINTDKPVGGNGPAHIMIDPEEATRRVAALYNQINALNKKYGLPEEKNPITSFRRVGPEGVGPDVGFAPDITTGPGLGPWNKNIPEWTR